MPRRSTWPPGGRPPRRLWRVVRRAILALIVALMLVAVPPALFVGVKCYDFGATRPRPRSAAPADIPGYGRSEAFTYLTLPEWFIVYSADEYARLVERASPTQFPYLGSVTQYWNYYSSVCGATRTAYPFEGGYHAMLGVIGASFTIEHVVKGLYEHTVGRATAWFGHDTAEDRFAAKVAADYATFMHTVPWYEFPFGAHLRRLWTEIPAIGSNPIRKLERRTALTIEYGAKAAYGWVIGRASRSAYGAEATTIHAHVDVTSEAIFEDPKVEKVRPTGRGSYIVRVPRYEAFTQTALALLDAGVRFRDIAGNDVILVTAIVPASFDERTLRTPTVIARNPMLTDAHRRRLALRVPVIRLHEIVPELRAVGATIEHLYDY
jgi:hypothetical protein